MAAARRGARLPLLLLLATQAARVDAQVSISDLTGIGKRQEESPQAKAAAAAPPPPTEADHSPIVSGMKEAVDESVIALKSWFDNGPDETTPQSPPWTPFTSWADLPKPPPMAQPATGAPTASLIGTATMNVGAGPIVGANVAPAEQMQAAQAATPKAATPKAATPKAATPKAAEPKAAEPKAAEPKAAEPKAAEPNAAAPEAAPTGRITPPPDGALVAGGATPPPAPPATAPATTGKTTAAAGPPTQKAKPIGRSKKSAPTALMADEAMLPPPPPPREGTVADTSHVTADGLAASTHVVTAGHKDDVHVTMGALRGNSFANADQGAITLTLQADVHRLGDLEEHVKTWQGPISLAVLISPGDVDQFNQWLTAMPAHVATWLHVHACYHTTKIAKGAVKNYPINVMRNVALAGATTEWVMVVDADDSTVTSMATYLHQVARAEAQTPSRAAAPVDPDQPPPPPPPPPGEALPAAVGVGEERVYCVTSWQWSSEAGARPTSKEELTRMQSDGRVILKHPNFPVAYYPPLEEAPMDVSKIWLTPSQDRGFHGWANMTAAKVVVYRDSYEPYFVMRRAAIPMFDERFVGFMGNAAFHTLQLAATQHTFVLLPDLFTFANDTVKDSIALRVPKDPILLLKAYKELGDSVGCPLCVLGNCLAHCPWVLRAGSDKAASLSGGAH